MTTKDAYWFSHDSNAKDDPKVVMMIEQLGLESYGIFWVLVEILREQPGFRYPLQLIPAIARRYNTTSEKVKAVIMNYGLFIIEDDEFFFSQSLNRRMLPLLEKKEQARIAANIRWEKQRKLCDNNGVDADAMRTHSGGNAIKVNKSKVNNIIKERLGDDFTEVVEDWLAYKNEKKQTYKSERSIKALCTKIKELSGGDVNTAGKVIDQSMANNWAGLFELKHEVKKPERKGAFRNDTQV